MVLRPAGYSVDDYTRKEVWFFDHLRKALKPLFGGSLKPLKTTFLDALWIFMMESPWSENHRIRFDIGWATHFRSFLHISYGATAIPIVLPRMLAPTQNGRCYAVRKSPCPTSHGICSGGKCCCVDWVGMAEESHDWWMFNPLKLQPRFHLSCRVDDFFWGVEQADHKTNLTLDLQTKQPKASDPLGLRVSYGWCPSSRSYGIIYAPLESICQIQM